MSTTVTSPRSHHWPCCIAAGCNENVHTAGSARRLARNVKGETVVTAWACDRRRTGAPAMKRRIMMASMRMRTADMTMLRIVETGVSKILVSGVCACALAGEHDATHAARRSKSLVVTCGRGAPSSGRVLEDGVRDVACRERLQLGGRLQPLEVHRLVLEVDDGAELLQQVDRGERRDTR